MFPESLLQSISSKNNKKNEEEEEKYLIMNQIMNNITAFVCYQDADYYLMIKKQINESFSYLFLTDYDRNFWLEKIDYEFLNRLKLQMKIQTTLLSFVEYLAEGFRKRVQIVELHPKAKIRVSLNLTEGLTINTIITLNVSIDQTTQPDQHILLLKAFFRQYFLIKEKQSPSRSVLTQECKNKEEGTKLLGESTKKNESIYVQPNSNLINRDLINPVRKKRKGLGMKFDDPVPANENPINNSYLCNKREQVKYSESRSRSRSKRKSHLTKRKAYSSSSESSSSFSQSSSYD